ncbi:MAG: GNAT family N-acetyltransferase [Shewanella sp.]|uniref:GNAT family N-acetyltransferase n=1 Tax=Shewanella sp. TaxID=50422 RepID=UPI003F2E2314
MQLELKNASLMDADLIYFWQTHPKTRQFALNQNAPSWPEHFDWLQKKLACTDDLFFIIYCANNHQSVGVIRLDKIFCENYLISIYVSPELHGKGIGKKGLQLVNEKLPSIIIHATILIKNRASQAIFTQAGYKRISAEKFIREPLC